MPRTFLAPRWLALHALVVAAVFACTWLGLWQWHAFRAASAPRPAQAGAPERLARVLAPGAPLDGRDVGRRVSATGTYDAAEQLLVPGRALAGRRGLHVVTPLRTTSGVLAVRRGWVSAADDPATAVPPGTVTVTGLLQPLESAEEDETRGAALPAGQVPVVSPTELHLALPYPPAQVWDGLLALTAQSPPAQDAPALVADPPETASGGLHRWQNLSYVGQWWLFGLAAVGFWAASVRAALRQRRDELEEAALAERASH